MNGNTKEIKYTLAREEMIELLEKYPFLVYRNIYSGEKTHDTLDEDIEYKQSGKRCYKHRNKGHKRTFF